MKSYLAMVAALCVGACLGSVSYAEDFDMDARAALALASVPKVSAPHQAVPATPNGCTCADGLSECICADGQQCPNGVCPVTTTSTATSSAPRGCVAHQHGGKTYHLEYGKSYQFPDCVVTVGYPQACGTCSGGSCAGGQCFGGGCSGGACGSGGFFSGQGGGCSGGSCSGGACGSGGCSGGSCGGGRGHRR